MNRQNTYLYDELERRYGPAIAQDLVDKMARARHMPFHAARTIPSRHAAA